MKLIYEADDGTTFDIAEEASKHEIQCRLAEHLKAVSYPYLTTADAKNIALHILDKYEIKEKQEKQD